MRRRNKGGSKDNGRCRKMRIIHSIHSKMSCKKEKIQPNSQKPSEGRSPVRYLAVSTSSINGIGYFGEAFSSWVNLGFLYQRQVATCGLLMSALWVKWPRVGGGGCHPRPHLARTCSHPSCLPRHVTHVKWWSAQRLTGVTHRFRQFCEQYSRLYI